MTDAPNGQDPTASLPSEPGRKPRATAAGGRFLALVRKLLDHGRDLVAGLQGRNVPTPPTDIAHRFGTFSLALIIARITRGLRLAEALESRLLRAAPAGERPERAARREPANPRPERPRVNRPKPDDDGELPDKLPSAEEIAARIRNRPAGAVLVEICRDLGIDANHPLWPEVRDAIMFFGGSLVTMLKAWGQRMRDLASDPHLLDTLPPLPPHLAALGLTARPP